MFGTDRRWRWVLLVVLALIVTVFEVVGAGLVFLLLGLLADPDTVAGVPGIEAVVERFAIDLSGEDALFVLAIAIAAFFMIRFLVLLSRAYVQQRLVHNAGALLADDLLRRYLRWPYLEHTRRSSAMLIRNVYDTTRNVVHKALRPVVDIVAETIVVVGLVALLLFASPAALLLAVVVLGPTVLLLQSQVEPRLRRLGRRLQDSRAASLTTLQHSLGGIRDLKLLGRSEVFAERHLHQRLEQARATYLSGLLIAVPRLLLETALVLTIVAVLLVALLSGTDLQQVLPVLGLFAYVGLRLQPSLQKIVEAANELHFSAAAIDDLIADLHHELPAAVEPDDGDAATFWSHIEVDGVSFAYRDGGPPVLHDVDLRVERGSFIGICGPTGGGKSTLLDLLTGLLEPTQGEVRVDDRVLGREPRWWWQQLGVVSQAVFLTDDTVRANIAFGEAEEEVDEARLRSAVADAQLEEVVAELPDGLDTRVGERGIQLSGGQRQRVAVARALYRAPPVLVFDEGTSALDVATESALVAALDHAHADRTLIAVAHRVVTLRDADRILVVTDGRIAAQGTYAELQAGSAQFRSLAG